jgi:iron complex transport system substrate-binding protein
MRIISLLPSATEIVAALGGAGDLVGVTHACDYPPTVDALKRVTACGVDTDAAPGTIDAQVRAISATGQSLYELDAALIAALQPDLILTQALCEVCAVLETDVIALAAKLSPTPAVVSLSATTLEGVLDDIARAGTAMSRDDDARRLLSSLRTRMDRVHRTLAAARAPRPRVAVIEWSDPIYAAGHWVPEMVRRAGGTDILATSGQHSRVVPIREVAEANPEIILVAPCGYGLAGSTDEAARLIALPEWELLRGATVWALDANAFTSRPGPRVVDGIDVMARIFHPQLFPSPNPLHAVQVHAAARSHAG